MKLEQFKKLIKQHNDKRNSYTDVFEITSENKAVWTNGFFVIVVTIMEQMGSGVYSVATNLKDEVRSLPNWRQFTEKAYSGQSVENLLHIGDMIKPNKKSSPIVLLDGKVVSNGKGINLRTLNMICEAGCCNLEVSTDGIVYAFDRNRSVEVWTCLTYDTGKMEV